MHIEAERKCTAAPHRQCGTSLSVKIMNSVWRLPICFSVLGASLKDLLCVVYIYTLLRYICVRRICNEQRQKTLLYLESG